jgi:uncharacterized metal-binding protein YceD (DUF177 family)
MKIDVTQLLADVGAREEISLTESIVIDVGDEAEVKSPVTLTANMVNTGMGIVVTGEISTVISMVCGICVKQFEEERSFEFEERFVSETEKVFPVDKEHEVQDEDIFFTYDGNLSLDFTEMIREIIILNLPIAPKCDINCQVQEQEKKKTIDPRLAVLAKLKKKTEDCNGCTKEEDN